MIANLIGARTNFDWLTCKRIALCILCLLVARSTNQLNRVRTEYESCVSHIPFRRRRVEKKYGTKDKCLCGVWAPSCLLFFLSSRKAYNFNRDARAMFTGISEYETVQPALAFKITIICPFRLHFYSHWRWVPECVVARPHIVIRYIKWRENAPTKWMWMNEMVFLQIFFFHFLVCCNFSLTPTNAQKQLNNSRWTGDLHHWFLVAFRMDTPVTPSRMHCVVLVACVRFASAHRR